MMAYGDVEVKEWDIVVEKNENLQENAINVKILRK
jgi:hypothetical protein